MMGVNTKPEVFIIESLTFADERAKRIEGEIISKILALSGKACEYYYVRTRAEVVKVLELFRDSRYRYLHLSCHANERSMDTTLESISFDALAKLLSPRLKDRRLFLSACSMASTYLADRLMPGSHCYSILGPAQDVGFNDAAILWASLYHVMFAADATAMKRGMLMAKAQEVADMYRVQLRYFARDAAVARGYVRTSIKPTTEVED